MQTALERFPGPLVPRPWPPDPGPRLPHPHPTRKILGHLGLGMTKWFTRLDPNRPHTHTTINSANEPIKTKTNPQHSITPSDVQRSRRVLQARRLALAVAVRRSLPRSSQETNVTKGTSKDAMMATLPACNSSKWTMPMRCARSVACTPRPGYNTCHSAAHGNRNR